MIVASMVFFLNCFKFWQYYSSFKGDRCFYWINRSVECPSESALLHLDIEWHSPTCDPTASEKLDFICRTIWTALSRHVPLIKENLSRRTPRNGWKNSWHIYADVTMEHNAEGCMKDFVQNEIWGRLKHRKDMWCGIKHKPLINLRIYTKDWAFKVIGSVKWCDRSYHKLPLPSKELFLATRMADRAVGSSSPSGRFVFARQSPGLASTPKTLAEGVERLPDTLVSPQIKSCLSPQTKKSDLPINDDTKSPLPSAINTLSGPWTNRLMPNAVLPLQPPLVDTQRPSLEPGQTDCIHWLWQKWEELTRSARVMRIFQHPRTSIQRTARKISRVALQNGICKSKMATMSANALCIATMGEGPILDTICTGKRLKFKKYCQVSKNYKTDAGVELDDAISHLWDLSSTVLKPILRLTQEKLPTTESAILLYKGLQAPNIHALEEYIRDLARELPCSWVWTSSLETAITEATPNRGKKGKLCLVDRRLQRKGYNDLITNNVGVVIAFMTTAIPIGDYTPSISIDEYLVPSRKPYTWMVQAAHTPAKKTRLLCPKLPPKPQPALTKLIDSELWLASITSTSDPHVAQAHGSLPCENTEPKIASPAPNICKRTLGNLADVSSRQPNSKSTCHWNLSRPPPALESKVKPTCKFQEHTSPEDQQNVFGPDIRVPLAPNREEPRSVCENITTNGKSLPPKKRKRTKANIPHQ